MIIHNFEQNSLEWHEVRLGKITASNFHVMLGKSKTRQDNINKIAAERLTNIKADADSFSNKHMERGNELEPIALNSYIFETNKNVETVGFVELNKYVGCSPDGLLDDDGVIEIKAPDNHVYLESVTKQKIKPEYYTQIQFVLYVTERSYCDFVLFNPNFQQSLTIIKVERDEEKIDQIKHEINNINTEIDSVIKAFEASKIYNKYKS